MLVLAIDSSATASVALGRLADDSPSVDFLTVRETENTRSHAEVMAPFVRETLESAHVKPSDIDAIVGGTGPGPFTGLRAGIVTARTLGFAWQVPVYGLMSLNALAEVAFTHESLEPGDEFVVATDARRREIYSAQYRRNERGYSLLSGPTVGPATEATDLPAFGMGAGIYREVMKSVAEFYDVQPTAQNLLRAAARCGMENLSLDTTALYLRDSDAKVPAARKKAGA